MNALPPTLVPHPTKAKRDLLGQYVLHIGSDEKPGFQIWSMFDPRRVAASPDNPPPLRNAVVVLQKPNNLLGFVSGVMVVE